MFQYVYLIFNLVYVFQVIFSTFFFFFNMTVTEFYCLLLAAAMQEFPSQD